MFLDLGIALIHNPYPYRRIYYLLYLTITVLIVHRIVLFGPGLLLPRWRTKKQARGRCPFFIIYKCYSELFTSIDRTCKRNIDFLTKSGSPVFKNILIRLLWYNFYACCLCFEFLAMTHISTAFSCARWLTDYFSRHEIRNIS